jgi:two-component system, OmpR family, response regulator
METASRRLRIYVVEDSEVLLKRLLEVLDAAGADIAGHSDSAATAIREILALTPDVAIVDIALRRGNGFDILRAFSQRNDATPIIIVLSNYASPPYRSAAKRFGVEYYFDKNTEIGSMLKVLASMAQERGIRNGSTDGAS